MDVVSFYDANTNTDAHLLEIEALLEDMESCDGQVIAGDFNTITNPLLDQRGHTGEQNRTQAYNKLKEW